MNHNSSSVKHKFAGLPNQRAICFMNSLLQSLFMTPEFRRKVYMCSYDEKKHGDKKNNILFNLQLLFAKMQLLNAPYVETKALKTSFGTNFAEYLQQHEVLQFLWLSLNMMKASVHGTQIQNIINSLYEGSIADYAKCLNCGHQSQETDTFLDLSLTIRNKLNKVYNDSVEKALSSFIKPQGISKHFCERCSSEQDALKGFKFEKLPHILVLELERFDIDSTTHQRIKLSDKVSFPKILNMNEFMKDFSQTEEIVAVNEVINIEKLELFKHLPQDLDWRDLEYICNKYNDEPLCDDWDKQPLQMDPFVEKKLIKTQTTQSKIKEQQKIKEYLAQGEFVYELFSIVIHSGSATGGHYYAYIKDFEDSRWYSFNDTVITPLDQRNIPKVFGGTFKTTDCSSSYSTNAYVLMYRMVKLENILSISESEVPKYIKNELEVDQNCISTFEIDEDYKRMNLKVFYKKRYKYFTVNEDEPFAKLKELAIEEFKLHHIQPQDLRIRGYHPEFDIPQTVYEEDLSFEEQGSWKSTAFIIEIKRPETEWLPNNPEEIYIKVHLWNSFLSQDPRSLHDKTKSPRNIIVNKTNSGKEMLHLLQEELEIPIENMVLLTNSRNNLVKTINTASNTKLNHSCAKIHDGNMLFIEEKRETTASRWKLLFKKESSLCTVRFNHPDQPSQHTSNTEWKLSVIVDSSSTLAVLKEKIARRIGIRPDEFIMKRNNCELKDMNFTLIRGYISNESLIHIERGIPIGPTEFRVLFSLAKPEHDDRFDHSYLDLFNFTIDSRVAISDLKKILAEQMIEKYPSMEVEPSRMRLRKRNKNQLMHVLREKNLLNQYSLRDNTQIAIQLLPECSRELEIEEIIVLAKRWWPSTWEISEGREIVVNKYATIDELGRVLSEEFNINRENLAFARVYLTSRFSRIDLRMQNFHETIGNNTQLREFPYDLNQDGVSLFAIDTKEEIRELTESESEKFSRNRSSSSSSSSADQWFYI